MTRLDTYGHRSDNAAMRDELVIEGIRLQARCGVTPDERRRPQSMLADLTMTCPARRAVQSDDISTTVDYARVVQRVMDVGAARETALIETLAAGIAQTLLADFPIERVTIWLRKTAPPLPDVSGSVGARLTYPRPDEEPATPASPAATSSAPSPFLTANAHVIPKGKVLDVAAGHGRHALFLASQGYEVVGLDRDADALYELARAARERRLPNLRTRTVDLEHRPDAADLGEREYDGIVVFFYLFRPLFPALLRALKPGGVLIYETFLIDNHLRHHHPRRKEFCLERNELLRAAGQLRVLDYQEGPQPAAPHAITARLVAQRELAA